MSRPITEALRAAREAEHRAVDLRYDALDRLAGQDDGTTYNSDDRPARVSRRTFGEVCRSGVVVGARKDGRAWSCSREAWAAARSRRPVPVAPTSGVRVGLTREQLVDLALERARGGRR